LIIDANTLHAMEHEKSASTSTAGTVNAVNNQIPKMDFITTAIESNVGPTRTTILSVERPGFIIDLKCATFRFNIG
jgi:hypothetical protein